MSKGVNKHCSILNYIRHADNELYELVQDLCIGRIFVPRRGSPGITFLRPDKLLLKEIQKMAAGENPEDAVEAIQSLVLLDNISSLREFEDKKSDIPTFLRKKLPVDRADGKKVKLKNKGEIVVDEDFMARGDRPNISVYILSGELVPPNTEAADFTNAKPKEKRGGADLGEADAYNKKFVFENIVSDTSDREPAMELLMALHKWASTNKPELAELIASQASYDTLASLAIVLQPYKTEGVTYVDNETWKRFKQAAYGMSGSGVNYRDDKLYSFNRNVMDDYEKLVDSKHSAADDMSKHVVMLADKVGRPSIVASLGKFYNSVPRDKLGVLRGSLSPKELFAEAELRVISAVLLDNEAGKEEVKRWFQKLDLTRPYMCDNKDTVASGNIGVYFSTVYLITRSNALFYVPGMNLSRDIRAISEETATIDLNLSLRDSRKSRRQASQDAIEERHKAIVNAF